MCYAQEYVQVLNVYMAKAPGSATGWAGDGNVWFKVYQISAVTDGGKTISWPSNGMSPSLLMKNQPLFIRLYSSALGLASVTFPIPKNVPSGE